VGPRCVCAVCLQRDFAITEAAVHRQRYLFGATYFLEIRTKGRLGRDLQWSTFMNCLEEVFSETELPVTSSSRISPKYRALAFPVTASLMRDPDWAPREIRPNILGTRKIAPIHPLKTGDHRVRDVGG
jgi:hypothetical protein